MLHWSLKKSQVWTCPKDHSKNPQQNIKMIRCENLKVVWDMQNCIKLFIHYFVKSLMYYFK